jgi:hypothetical protein
MNQKETECAIAEAAGAAGLSLEETKAICQLVADEWNVRRLADAWREKNEHERSLAE